MIGTAKHTNGLIHFECEHANTLINLTLHDYSYKPLSQGLTSFTNCSGKSFAACALERAHEIQGRAVTAVHTRVGVTSIRA